jgi:hypothetical protein
MLLFLGCCKILEQTLKTRRSNSIELKPEVQKKTKNICIKKIFWTKWLLLKKDFLTKKDFFTKNDFFRKTIFGKKDFLTEKTFWQKRFFDKKDFFDNKDFFTKKDLADKKCLDKKFEKIDTCGAKISLRCWWNLPFLRLSKIYKKRILLIWM